MNECLFNRNCLISSKRKLFGFLEFCASHNFQKMFFTDMREMRYAMALNKENCSVNFISWLFWACFHWKTLRVDHLTTSTRLMITPFPRQQKKEGKAIASGFQQTIKAKMLLYFIYFTFQVLACCERTTTTLLKRSLKFSSSNLEVLHQTVLLLS